MLYRHRHFRLDTDSESVFDENGKPLAFTKHLFRALRALCEHVNIDTDELGDLINGGESDHFYNHNTIRQYRYRINKLIGYDVVRYEKQRFFLYGGVDQGEDPESFDADTIGSVSNHRSDAPQKRNIPLFAVLVLGMSVVWVVSLIDRNPSVFGKSASDDMVLVPEGEFLMGSTEEQMASAYGMSGQVNLWESYFPEYPQRTVFLPDFLIDRKEVSNADYLIFADDTGRNLPELSVAQNLNAPNQPVVGVDWNEADAYCQWVGKRLPTEAEWEKAARGTDGRIFPWGNEWEPKKDNHGDGSPFGTDGSDSAEYTAPVATEAGVGPYGTLNMSGNVSEWVSDDFDMYPGNDKYSYILLNKGAKTMKGGAFYGGLSDHRGAARIGYPKDFRDYQFGFRCAKDAK